MAEQYTLDQITGYIASERQAIHGISPGAFHRNGAVFSELAHTATELSPDFLAVQSMGSMVNGTSYPYSDLDLVVITFDTERAEGDRATLTKAAVNMLGPLKVDTQNPYLRRLGQKVPIRAGDFTRWIETNIGHAAALFSGGIHATPELKLMRMAALEVLQSNSLPWEEAEQTWSEVRRYHAAVYLGQLLIMQEKLGKRLEGYTETDIAQKITPELMATRLAAFGLPKHMNSEYAGLYWWANENESDLRTTRGWQLMTDVARLVARQR